jgi:hypothetical protein
VGAHRRIAARNPVLRLLERWCDSIINGVRMPSIHRTFMLLAGLVFAGCGDPSSSLTGPGVPAGRDPRILTGPDNINLEILGMPQATHKGLSGTSTRLMKRTVSSATEGLQTDVMQSVTGHYEFVGINTGNDFKYSVSAIRHEDGSISGEFEERVTLNSTGDFIRQTHGTVTCFEIVGNLARIGGLVDQATDPRFLPGTEFRLVVVDNGEGASDPPDLGSNARFGFPGTAQAFCNAGTAFNLEPVDHGNVEVRP